MPILTKSCDKTKTKDVTLKITTIPCTTFFFVKTQVFAPAFLVLCPLLFHRLYFASGKNYFAFTSVLFTTSIFFNFLNLPPKTTGRAIQHT